MVSTVSCLMIKVLFVCLGNICRSPTAHGVFEQTVANAGLSGQISVDSAGTADWHVDEPPDPRTIRAARERGIDLSRQRGRQVTVADFAAFDSILAMDRANLQALQRLCPARHQYKLRLFLDYAPHLGLTDVPDPYYGGPQGFQQVLDLIEAAAAGLLADIRRNALPLNVSPSEHSNTSEHCNVDITERSSSLTTET